MLSVQFQVAKIPSDASLAELWEAGAIDIENISFKVLEDTHNIIQVLFPTRRQSDYSSASPFLSSPALIEQIKRAPDLKKYFTTQMRYFAAFLCYSKKPVPAHNKLRCTRVMDSLKIFDFPDLVQQFRDLIQEVPFERGIDDALHFWNKLARPIEPPTLRCEDLKDYRQTLEHNKEEMIRRYTRFKAQMERAYGGKYTQSVRPKPHVSFTNSHQAARQVVHFNFKVVHGRRLRLFQEYYSVTVIVPIIVPTKIYLTYIEIRVTENNFEFHQPELSLEPNEF